MLTMEERACNKQNDKQPAEAQALLHATFNNAPDYHVLLNKDLQITLFNQAAHQFTQTYFNLHLEVNKRIVDYMSPEFSSDFEKLCYESLKGQNVNYEYFVRRNDNEGVWFNFIINPVYNSTKNVIGLSIVGVCIDDLKKHEKTIRHQSDTLSFIAQLQSHQVRQPVSSILGLMNLIKEENYKPQKEYLDGLEQATKQLDSIIQLIVSKSRDC